ncbi:hypothetical protein BN135_2406 [Cronobacter muytjensii 530]
MMLGQRDRRGGSDRDAFIRRAEQQIEIDAGIDQRLSIKTAQQRQIAPGIKQTGVKEVRALTPGFQRELTKFKHLFVKGEFNKLALIRFHGFAPQIAYCRHKKGDSSVALKISLLTPPSATR